MNDLLLFCNIDEYGFPHWNGIDLFRWYAMPTNWHYMTGNAYLWLYKTSWLVYYREAIKKYAKEAEVPEWLLAGVAVAEVGGTPEVFKGVGVLQARQVFDEITQEKNKYSNKTSVGSIAIQLGVAAETLGIDPDELDHFQQFRLAQCLLNNDFNIRVVAFHLRDLILYDNPGINTSILTDEQIILAGSRYNRGRQRNRGDIISSIHSPVGAPSREYSEYGRRILEKKETIMQILNGR
ncbi:TPA: hypothetical protein JD203_20095 [Cronobacter sakazakii]|uniref:hypothetical protein n=1 Tax=Cronobacter sakazakii TaxID=28141 RepID=UPI0004A946BC|nr:hypothetical protein [Cronobacter sakazakii]EGT5207700.1 hypothetical protein [Cronobacter sakazakii]EGT5650227.1 hypothetical protein [Cronobacter sakazakii]EGT5750053.1 hypothetical protein [Cronobacter sakazakii]EGT5754275.1 hypothetical protein [Cronobacter sakazakii]EIZ2182166.1 hypothetical protein [Cronobacter sakazakii]